MGRREERIIQGWAKKLCGGENQPSKDFGAGSPRGDDVTSGRREQKKENRALLKDEREGPPASGRNTVRHETGRRRSSRMFNAGEKGKICSIKLKKRS